MPTATVKVRYVNQREGNKPPSIKTPEGMYYNLSDDQIALVQENGSYTFDYHTKLIRGREYKIVDKVTAAQQQSTGSVNSGRSYGQTDDKTAERIFVCGAINSCLSNPGESVKFYMDNPNEGVKLVNYWRDVWSRTFGGKPTAGDEMQDEIPFA